MRAEGFFIETIDLRARPQLGEKYGIRSAPTFIYIRDGKVVRSSYGEQSTASLRRMWRDPWMPF